MLDSKDLWPALRRRTERALASGALEPLTTRREYVEDGGVRFVVHALDRIERKRREARRSSGNPFMPYDEDLFVGDVSRTHVALLNKFNVIDHHLLIVTRRFEDQRSPLGSADFEALWRCMAGFAGLGFYNAGLAAGASQPHKHLQLVPLPLASEGDPVPIERLLGRAGEVPAALDTLAFRHLVARIDSLARRPFGEAARALCDRYGRMIDVLGAAGRPYNLLVTRGWMMVVPRRREHFGSISINALGFAGSLIVRDERELQRIKRAGPMAVLRAVGEEAGGAER